MRLTDCMREYAKRNNNPQNPKLIYMSIELLEDWIYEIQKLEDELKAYEDKDFEDTSSIGTNTNKTGVFLNLLVMDGLVKEMQLLQKQ